MNSRTSPIGPVNHYSFGSSGPTARGRGSSGIYTTLTVVRITVSHLTPSHVCTDRARSELPLMDVSTRATDILDARVIG